MSRAMAAAPDVLCMFRGGARRATGTLHSAVRRAWLYGAGALGGLRGGAGFGAALDV
ncbi:hypothetical protein [Streptomyces sp. NBC_00996]|uniref:hypothetical protein n=1 Tax=Streptomyces sp. NBC_00996 TaxID=2903710 RepID=UPI003870E954|nr:hypothetical protein OG390_04220 [Streptomyces sp. NBC_00996]